MNKVASKVELRFDVQSSEGLSEEEKHRLVRKLGTRMSRAQELVLQCDESRSQHKNKELVTQRFLDLVKQNLVKPKTRKQTKIPRAAKLQRLKNKKQQAEKKAGRRNPFK